MDVLKPITTVYWEPLLASIMLDAYVYITLIKTTQNNIFESLVCIGHINTKYFPCLMSFNAVTQWGISAIVIPTLQKKKLITKRE